MSSFSGIMVTFVFPIYFRNVIVTNGHGDAYWGFTLSISMLLVAVCTPLLGAMADVLGNKKLFLGLFASTTILCTIFLYFMQPGMVILAAALFVLANVGYEGGTVFYDAFLPEITTPDSFGRISGIGYAFGYCGSLAILLINFPLLEHSANVTFLVTAAFFAVFSLPLFFVVPQRRKRSELSLPKLVLRGVRQLVTTTQHIREYRNIARFLVAFFIYNDAILTVILFSGIFAKTTLHFGMTDLAIWFAMIQIVAVIGSVLFGRFADRRGPKLAITITLCIWIAVVTAAFFTTTAAEFYVLGAVAGISLGSSQACSRGLMALLTPPEHTAEFFGFYDGFCGKASAIIGPIVFGLLSDWFGSQRPAIWALAIFFVVGLLLLRRVDAKRAVREESWLAIEIL